MLVRYVVLLLTAFALTVQPLSAAPLDWVVPSGQFFTQTGDGQGIGYIVSDADGIPFLSELRARGGAGALGYPISRRFEWKGTTVQAFQKAVLQWIPGEKRIFYLNVFDDLSQAGRDEWLRTARSTPGQVWLENEGKLSWEQVVKGRMALLDANPAIKARYLSVADPTVLFGLPSSGVEDMGNHFAVRLQRAVIQQWKVDVPWAKAGQVTVANGGDIAKESGMFPAEALVPTTPDGTLAEKALVPPGPVAPPSAGAAPPAPPAVAPPAQTFRVEPIREVPRAGEARRVVIDAGHGGGQIGSSGTLPNGQRLQEKEVNLDITRRVAALLRQAGYEVTLTRDADRQVGGPRLADDLQARIDIANRARADVFVSVHHNGLGNRSARGLEVYYATDRPFTHESRALAEILYQQIGRHMAAAGYDAVPRGVRADTTAAGNGDHFFLLSPKTRRVQRPSLMPAALVEALFMTNHQDLAQLARPELRETIARGYAVAIGTFLHGRKPWMP